MCHSCQIRVVRFHKGGYVSSLESVWERREEVMYPMLFGGKRRGIFVLTGDDFTKALGQETYDPRWLHLGVFEFEPTPERNTWLYVTSGGSTPWETEPSEYNPSEYSWLGVELVIEAPVKSKWAIMILQRLLAYNVLVCHGQFGEVPALDYGHRIPVGGPIDPDTLSELRHVVISQPDHYPSQVQLDSGKFDFLHVTGVTDAEIAYAKANSTNDLIELLKANGVFPVTDPMRTSIAQ